MRYTYMIKRYGDMTAIYYDGIKYTKLGKYYRGSRGFLHRVIWSAENGEIPKGCHIHHIDGNPENNSIENLECVDGKKHISMHHKGHGRTPWAAIKASVEWRKTEEGKKFSTEMGKRNSHFMHQEKTLQCEECGVTFTVKGSGKFCSNKCKSKYRRKSGVDDVTRACVRCESEFKVNKYRKTKHCSKSCERKDWLETDEGRKHLDNLANKKREKTKKA